MGDAPASVHDRIAGRRLRVGVYVAKENSLVVERTFDAGADVTVGADESAALVVPGWVGPSLCVFSKGVNLHLGPGMRLHLCHDEGEDRVHGTFEELTDAGFTFPLRLTVSKLNIRVRDGVAVFAH
jgi:hypothetical protein